MDESFSEKKTCGFKKRLDIFTFLIPRWEWYWKSLCLSVCSCAWVSRVLSNSCGYAGESSSYPLAWWTSDRIWLPCQKHSWWKDNTWYTTTHTSKYGPARGRKGVDTITQFYHYVNLSIIQRDKMNLKFRTQYILLIDVWKNIQDRISRGKEALSCLWI